MPGAKGVEEYIHLVKAAAFHPSFFGQYIKLVPSNVFDCIRLIDELRNSQTVPMMRFKELMVKVKAICGGSETAVLEILSDLHEAGKIFWFGKNRAIGDHGDDIVFVDVQWLIDALYCLLDRETVQQMAAQVKKTSVYEGIDIEQCQAFIDHGIMSINILKRLLISFPFLSSGPKGGDVL